MKKWSGRKKGTIELTSCAGAMQQANDCETDFCSRGICEMMGKKGGNDPGVYSTHKQAMISREGPGRNAQSIFRRLLWLNWLEGGQLRDGKPEKGWDSIFASMLFPSSSVDEAAFSCVLRLIDRNWWLKNIHIHTCTVYSTRDESKGMREHALWEWKTWVVSINGCPGSY